MVDAKEINKKFYLTLPIFFNPYIQAIEILLH